MRGLTPVVVGLAVMAGPAGAGDPAPAPLAVAVLERDLPRLIEMFEGEWDNAEQVSFASELGYPAGSPPLRRHLSVRRVEAPRLGAHVLRLDEYLENDPSKPGRQRLYAFAVDAAEMAIRMDVLTPREPERLPPDVDHAGLTREAMVLDEGCRTWWRAVADQFTGWTRGGACRAPSGGDGGPAANVDANQTLSATQLWVSETARDPAGRARLGGEPDLLVRYRRSTPFTCWIAVPRQPPQEGWFYARDLAIHDQGGEVWIATDESPARTFGFRMRNVRWPTGPNADALTLYAHDAPERPAIGYAWASPDATRVGINLRTLQGSCSR